MSRPHETNIKASVMQYATALLLSLGMGLSVLSALLPGQAIWPALLWCAIFSLGFHLFFILPLPRKWILPLLLLIGFTVWGFLGGGPGHTLLQMLRALNLTLRGIPDALAPYADAARLMICLLFSLIAVLLAWDNTLPLALFSVLLVIFLSFIFGGGNHLLLYILPAAAGLLIMMAQNHHTSLTPLPVALVLALCAFLLMPGGNKPLPALEKAADSIRQFVEDYLFFNEYRTSFSLGSEGYMPLSDRLGGEAHPNPHSVMEVTTDRTVLLRGKAYDDYSGLNWYDSLSARRYLYLSPRYTALRDELFDLNRPLTNASVSAQTVQIHMLTDATTTVFTPQRTRTLQLDGERMVLYYNLASELFLTRDLQAGDTYTLTYLPYAPGDKITGQIIAACADLQDDHYAQAADQYTSLPSHIQQEIFDIAIRATQGANTPYEKALAIQNYLRKNYTYTLDTQTPPEGVDFVAWFLLGEKEGYCTYFATAMTVLCRTLDIPARYVTGYLAVPDESGKALVTGKNAHAWVEVYLNGFGWLDFDPTPRSDNERGDNDDADHSATPPPVSPEPSSVPSPSPSPSPSPTPELQESELEPSPSPENPENNPPTPTPPPMPTPQPSDAPENPDEPPQPPFPGWILLLILLLAALIIWRYLATDPERLASRHPEQAAMIYFSALCGLLSLQHIRREAQETLHDFARRADESLQDTFLPTLTPLVEIISAQVYGRHIAPAAPFRKAYLKHLQALPWYQRMFTTLRHMVIRG